MLGWVVTGPFGSVPIQRVITSITGVQRAAIAATRVITGSRNVGSAVIVVRLMIGTNGSAKKSGAENPTSNGPERPIAIGARARLRIMRVIVAIGLLFALTCQSETVFAQTAQQVSPPRTEQFDMRPIVVGLGAIAGVVVFNVMALGVEALPGGFAYAAGATVPAEMSVAMSRVYATTSAVIGGWIGYYGSGR